MAPEHRPQGVGIARKLVAELESLVADGLALGQRGFERRLASQRGEIVVGP